MSLFDKTMSKLEYDPLLSVIANPLASSRPNVVQDALNWEKEQFASKVERLEREKKQLAQSNEKLRHANKHYRSKIAALEVENKEYHDANEKLQRSNGRHESTITHLENEIAEHEVSRLRQAREYDAAHLSSLGGLKKENEDLKEKLIPAEDICRKLERKVSRAKNKRDAKIRTLEVQLGEQRVQSEDEICRLRELLELASMVHEDQEQKMARLETSYEGLQGRLERLAFRSRMYQSESVKGCSSVSDTLDEILLEHR